MTTPPDPTLTGEEDWDQPVTLSLDSTMTLGDLVELLAEAIPTDEEMIRFIMMIDGHVGDWDFTLALADKLDEQRLIHRKATEGDI